MNYIKLVRYILNFFDHLKQEKILKLFQKKFLKPITIIDVGAHYGETIEILQKKLQIKKIFSFEASPTNFRILEKNYKKKKFSNVEIFNMGLGDIPMESFINQTKESSSSTINKLNINSKYLYRKLKLLKIKKEEDFIQKLPIKITTLDNLINEKNIENIDLLKIDTEGYEYKVLKGIKKNHSKIKIIYFEHHYDDMIIKNYTFGQINSLLREYGFKMVKKNKMLFRKSFEYVYENQIKKI